MTASSPIARVRVRRPDPPVPCPDWLWRETAVAINVPCSPSVVMGIDASLTATGVAIIENGKMHAEVLSPPKDQNRGMPRLAWFRARIVQLVRAATPELIFIEGYGFGAKGHAHSLGELGGVIKLALYDCGVPVELVPPTVLKLFSTGKGNAEKDVVSKELYKRFGVDLMNNNEVDAAGLAIMALARVDPQFAAKLTAPQAKALEKTGS